MAHANGQDDHGELEGHLFDEDQEASPTSYDLSATRLMMRLMIGYTIQSLYYTCSNRSHW